jgi:hypothetical protein
MQRVFYSMDKYMSFQDPLHLSLFLFNMHIPFLELIPLKQDTRKSYTSKYVSILYYITVIQEQIKRIIVAAYVHFQRNV